MLCITSIPKIFDSLSLFTSHVSYDLGIGAGFYVNATKEPYSTHYHMYSYVTEGESTSSSSNTFPIFDSFCHFYVSHLGSYYL